MRVVFSGGGTGGHIYPALATAQLCRAQDPKAELLYVGTTNGLEKELVAKEGIRFEAIEISGFRRKLSFHNVKTIWRFVRGVSRAKRILKQFKPDIVVGTGGYVCGPVLYAAAKLGIPTLVHEQNAIPGLTNSFLSRYVSSMAVSFKGTDGMFPKAKRTIYTGNPRATAVTSANAAQGYASLDIPEGTPIAVVVGGSRGAKALNEAMVSLAQQARELPQVHFVLITGKPYYEETLSRIGEHEAEPNVHVLPYVHNMPEVLAATTVIVSRSGASSLAEITALGIPSILIPSPNVTNNHQEANARSLEKEGAAIVVLEKALNGDRLFQLVSDLMTNRFRREEMSNRSKSLGQPDAAQRLYTEMKALLRT